MGGTGLEESSGRCVLSLAFTVRKELHIKVPPVSCVGENNIPEEQRPDTPPLHLHSQKTSAPLLSLKDEANFHQAEVHPLPGEGHTAALPQDVPV
ncbi:hypothetical protein AGIG_G7349 [Arapaima gigas]